MCNEFWKLVQGPLDVATCIETWLVERGVKASDIHIKGHWIDRHSWCQRNCLISNSNHSSKNILVQPKIKTQNTSILESIVEYVNILQPTIMF